MKVYGSLEDFVRLDCAVVTTGTFDGVHLGHRTILDRLCSTAAHMGGESVLLTFDPHPRKVLQPEIPLKLLNSLEEKQALLAETGLDHLIVQPFTQAFSRTGSLEYVRNILVNRVGVRKLVMGHDHHFGRNREGSFEHLKEFGPVYGFEVEEIPALDVDAVAVSSTKIRTALAEGNVVKAEAYLGYRYGVDGVVEPGDQIGRTLGFPTANVRLNDQDKMMPRQGVYAVEVDWKGRRYGGMAHWGPRPVLDRVEERFEVHLFDFEGDLYQQPLRLRFVQWLRPVVPLDGLSGLIAQLKQDEIEARRVLSVAGTGTNRRV
ncbi:bifunctional riboflavin kinase/FAD synthetase [bacterium]|nr:bifunctional riboflavin kinase/FAD synthetase [bacterium]